MSKKSKPSKHRKTLPTSNQQIDKQIDLAGEQIFRNDYVGAVETCQRLLRYQPQRAVQRAQVLNMLGVAQSMLQNFPESYAAYTEALSLEPDSADLWFNRGMASRFTMRLGQSLRDFERAAELNTERELKSKIDEALKFSRKMAKESLKLRGPDFTLDQLIEQENHFQDGLKLMEAGEWEEAGEAFQRSIEMGDVLPQPWGNLGTCLMMQERYDEAEEAFKRALKIDRKYDLAKHNLAALPEVRRTGPPKMVGMRDPFKGSNLKQSITFVREK